MIGHDNVDNRVADREHSGRGGNDHLAGREAPRETRTHKKGRIHEVDVHHQITVERFPLAAQIEDDRTAGETRRHATAGRVDPQPPTARAVPPEIARWAPWATVGQRSPACPSSRAPTDRRNLLYFAWQDSRAGTATTNAEDIYFASLKLEPDEMVVGSTDDTDAAWPLALAGVALGMGIAMALALGMTRRRATPQRIAS